MLTVLACAIASVFVPIHGPGRRLETRPLTTGSFFEEMADLHALARLPAPWYRTVQFSSYDRRSQTPGGPGWFANDDGFGGESIPNFEKVLREPEANGQGEYLMADVAGPGVIVRLWTAAISGRLRVFVDDMATPFYEGEAEPFFRRPYSSFPEFQSIEQARFGTTVYQRDASYAPIPFASHLRMVWIGNIKDIHFYQIQVRKYGPGTEVVAFTPGDIARYKDTIDRVTLALAEPDAVPALPSSDPARRLETTLAPGETKEVLQLKGPGAVGRFWLRLDAPNLDAALRQTVLKVRCDGAPRGQVQCPVGDFFGAAPGINPYRSLPFTVGPDGRMASRFVMPFQSSLTMVLTNLGDQTVHVEGEAVPVEFEWDDRTLHFRAGWRVDHGLVASGEDVQDLTFLIARGQGAFVGATAILLNPAGVPSPWGNWWGEGDEKVFVDDDQFPSIFGTGSEDYYNYSWSSPDIFFFPYCGQPRNDGPGNRGFVTNFRWHILDRIPFASSIDFRMELNSHERTPGLSYARTAYFYARPGTLDDVPDIKPEDVRELRLGQDWQPAARFGARNAVFYEAESLLTDLADTAFRNGGLWSGGRVLVWTPKRVGERKTLKFPVAAGGTFRVHLTAGLLPSSGRLSAWLDGEPAAPTEPMVLDLFDSFRTLSRTFSLEPAQLAAGQHALVLEYRGADPSVSHPEIALDFVWVQSVGGPP